MNRELIIFINHPTYLLVLFSMLQMPLEKNSALIVSTPTLGQCWKCTELSFCSGFAAEVDHAFRILLIPKRQIGLILKI